MVTYAYHPNLTTYHILEHDEVIRFDDSVNLMIYDESFEQVRKIYLDKNRSTLIFDNDIMSIPGS